jgi:hypothetical protein
MWRGQSAADIRKTRQLSRLFHARENIFKFFFGR